MSRKDYLIIAAALKEAITHTDVDTADIMVETFCTKLKEANANFDRNKFRTEVYRD